MIPSRLRAWLGQAFRVRPSKPFHRPAARKPRMRLGIELLEDRTVPALFAATIDLSGLNGGTGFALNGIADNDYAGFSVSQAGDVPTTWPRSLMPSA
jgi:hypothetical protein